MRKASIRNPKRVRRRFVSSPKVRSYTLRATFEGEQAQFQRWCRKLEGETP